MALWTSHRSIWHVRNLRGRDSGCDLAWDWRSSPGAGVVKRRLTGVGAFLNRHRSFEKRTSLVHTSPPLFRNQAVSPVMASRLKRFMRTVARKVIFWRKI
jgi:hypothetical protein